MTQLLLIDDDDATREVLSLLLEAEGWQVTAAPNGDSAVPTARANQPDVILSDLHMPGTCGAELARLLRNACDSVVLLAMTATPLAAVPEGYDALLVKPFQPAAVRSLATGIAPAATPQTPNRAVSIDESILQGFLASMPAAQVRNLYDFALADAATRVNRLASAADCAVFQHEAHALKGSCAMVGAHRLRDMAAAAEDLGPSSLFKQSTGIADFHAEIEAVRRMLEGQIPGDI